MMNWVTPTLLAIGKEVDILKSKLVGLSAGFDKMGHNAKAALIGGGATGFAIVDGFIKATEHASELLKVQNQLTISGVSQLEIADATAKAFEVQQKYGVKVADVLKDIRELRMPVGSTAHAVDFIEDLERMRIVLNAFKEGTGDRAKEALYSAARSGELMGLKTNEDFRNLFQAETQAITASGGKITPQGFLAAAQYGRVATQGWSQEFVDKWLPTLIQEQAGMQAGTGLMSLFRNIAQGHTPLGSTQALQEYGLLTDPSKLVYNKKGEIKGFHYGAVERSDLLVQDPYKWAQEVLAPALRKKLGADIAPNDPKVIGAIGDLISQRTAAQSAAIMTLQPQRFEKDAKLIGETMGLKGADYLIKNDPYAAMSRFTAAWDALLTKLGGPLVGPATEALNHFADALNKLADGALITSIESLGDQIIAAFKKMFDAVGEWLKSWLPDWALKATPGSFEGGGGAGGLIQKASYGGAAGRGAYNVSKAYDLIKQAGGTDEEARMLAAISQPESGGNPLAHNTNVGTGDNSYGLWQINMLGAMGPQRRRQFGLSSNEDLFDPATNARVALQMHRRAGSYRDWSTYSSGAYRKYMSTSPPVPSYKGGGQTAQDIHVHTHLDGQVVASNTVRQILKSTEHSRGAAYFDGYGTFAGADRQTATA